MTKNKLLKNTRKIIALLMGILYIVGFLGIFYPIKLFDTALIPLLSRIICDFSLFALILLIFFIGLTAIFGRIYCSTLCPLGLAQELFLFFFHRTNLPLQKSHPCKYFIAAVVFGTFIGGTSFLIQKADPYSIFGSAFSGAAIGLCIIGIIAILTWYKGRFFCTNLCPLGTILGLISKHAYNKVYITDENCVACGLCAKKCPAGCIDVKNKTINNETCIKCFKCLPLCHNHGINYAHPPRKSKTAPFDPLRRRFIIGSSALILFAAAYKSGIKLKNVISDKLKKVILPAGAGSKERFVNKCLNCNLCVENCPMKIIKKADDSFPAIHIEYNKSFCDYDCHKCSQICPSGAIKRLTLKQKRHTQIGLAVVNQDACIQCGLCVTECPRSAITKPRGEFPQISPEICVGCGACQAVCPAAALTIKPVDAQKLLNLTKK